MSDSDYASFLCRKGNHKGCSGSKIYKRESVPCNCHCHNGLLSELEPLCIDYAGSYGILGFQLKTICQVSVSTYIFISGGVAVYVGFPPPLPFPELARLDWPHSWAKGINTYGAPVFACEDFDDFKHLIARVLK